MSASALFRSAVAASARGASPVGLRAFSSAPALSAAQRFDLVGKKTRPTLRRFVYSRSRVDDEPGLHARTALDVPDPMLTIQSPPSGAFTRRGNERPPIPLVSFADCTVEETESSDDEEAQEVSRAAADAKESGAHAKKKPVDKSRGAQEKFAVKDANIIFERVWGELEGAIGRENMLFPKEIIWLMGAPGAGKGTNVPFIMEERGITAEAIEISRLLDDDPDAREKKANGKMVSDETVLGLLFRALLRKENENGAVVDGFPRTQVQVRFVKYLHDKMYELRRQYHSENPNFRRPQFRVCVLSIDKETSVQRQMERGRRAKEWNEKILRGEIPAGDGVPSQMLEERPTDFDLQKACSRYEVFEAYYSTLTSLREHFTFTIIEANQSLEKVQQSIRKEFEYQSHNEIATETLDVIQKLPLVGELKRHARQSLVRRLDNYQCRNKSQFERVVQIISDSVVPEMYLHVFGGEAVARLDDPVFEERLAVFMAIDVLTERGYDVSTQKITEHVPESIDPKSNKIVCKKVETWEVRVRFPSMKLRKITK